MTYKDETKLETRISETPEYKILFMIAGKTLVDRERNGGIRQIYRIVNVTELILNIKTENINWMPDERL